MPGTRPPSPPRVFPLRSGRRSKRRLVAGIKRPLRQLWPTRLWNFDKHYQYIGAQGGAGIGYQAPAAVGAALANKKHGRLTVNIQCDGDLNYAPGVLWTAAHHQIPMLNVMHNNRAYHEERMYLALLGAKYDRDMGRSDIGTALSGPSIDYARLRRLRHSTRKARSPIPRIFGPALKRAIARVKAGEPALLDVLTQPR
jgi:thiamine pyrophosphate-dependent acetolactate synthase large subunit-like protein